MTTVAKVTGPSTEERERAALEGRTAGRMKRPATDCPYSPNGSGKEKVLAMVWVRGYLATHPTAASQVSLDG